jgi:hypothetical protein
MKARRHPNRSLSQAAALKEMYREEEKKMRQNLKSAFYGFSGAIVRKPYSHPVCYLISCASVACHVTLSML